MTVTKTSKNPTGLSTVVFGLVAVVEVPGFEADPITARFPQAADVTEFIAMALAADVPVLNLTEAR